MCDQIQGAETNWRQYLVKEGIPVQILVLPLSVTTKGKRPSLAKCLT